MLHVKYSPKNINEAVCNLNVIKGLKKYLKSNDKETFFVLYGKSGSGKTLTSHLVLKDLDLKYVEINSLDKINKTILESKLKNIIHFSFKSAILIEDSDTYINDLISVLKVIKLGSTKIIIIARNSIKDIRGKKSQQFETSITNVKLYNKFISKIKNNECSNIKSISEHISKFDGNIRECINSISNESTKDIGLTYNNAGLCRYILNTKDLCYTDKYNIINSDSLVMIFMIHEILPNLDISMDDMISIQNHVIEADLLHTEIYSTQKWICTKYLSNICISILSILDKYDFLQSVILKNSCIWSNYSNICTKFIRLNKILENCPNLIYSLKIFKNIQLHILDCVQSNDTDGLIVIQKKYDLSNENILSILCLNFPEMKTKAKNILKK